MKPVRLPASATLALPRWALFALGLLYILPGLIGRDPWKDDADSFGIMWTMSRGGLEDWLYPNVAGLPALDEGPLAFWVGALCIKLFGWLLGDVLAARLSNIGIFLPRVAANQPRQDIQQAKCEQGPARQGDGGGGGKADWFHR